MAKRNVTVIVNCGAGRPRASHGRLTTKQAFAVAVAVLGGQFSAEGRGRRKEAKRLVGREWDMPSYGQAGPTGPCRVTIKRPGTKDIKCHFEGTGWAGEYGTTVCGSRIRILTKVPIGNNDDVWGRESYDDSYIREPYDYDY